MNIGRRSPGGGRGLFPTFLSARWRIWVLSTMRANKFARGLIYVSQAAADMTSRGSIRAGRFRLDAGILRDSLQVWCAAQPPQIELRRRSGQSARGRSAAVVSSDHDYRDKNEGEERSQGKAIDRLSPKHKTASKPRKRSGSPRAVES